MILKPLAVLLASLSLLGCTDLLDDPSEEGSRPSKVKCDATCDFIFVIAKWPDGTYDSIIGGTGRKWQAVSYDNGNKAALFNPSDSTHAVDVQNAEDLLLIDLKKSTYKTVRATHHAPWTPTLQGDSIFYSSSEHNPRGNRLYRYNIKTGKTERALSPWNLTVALPGTLTDNGNYCLSMRSFSHDAEPADLPAHMAAYKSYCFPMATYMASSVMEDTLSRALLPGAAGDLWNLSIDTSGHYAAGRRMDAQWGAWRIVDLTSGEAVREIPADRNNTLALSGNGKFYAFATGAGDAIHVEVFDTATGASVRKLEVSKETMGDLVLRRAPR